MPRIKWNVGKLTLNLGIRMDRIRGVSPVLDDTVYAPAVSWGPRLGAAFDVTGKDTTVLKAFWDGTYEGSASGFYTQATPGLEDYTSTEILPGGGTRRNRDPHAGAGVRHRRRHRTSAHR